jgi:hypothetical protein
MMVVREEELARRRNAMQLWRTLDITCLGHPTFQTRARHNRRFFVI